MKGVVVDDVFLAVDIVVDGSNTFVGSSDNKVGSGLIDMDDAELPEYRIKDEN